MQNIHVLCTWLLPWWHRKALTQWHSLVFIGTWNIRLNFLASEVFDRQRECRLYTAGCVNKMAVSVTGPRAVNELGTWLCTCQYDNFIGLFLN